MKPATDPIECVDVAVDIGGTFTDVVMVDAVGQRQVAKVPSTRPDPSTAVDHVLSSLLPNWGVRGPQVRRFIHGTTVATNAVLERKGATTGILTTEGFSDVLEIGRQNRKELYDLVIRPQTPVFLAPGARRKGVVEAIGPDGKVVTPLNLHSLAASAEALIEQGVDSIAICFLFSFVNPVHEQIAASYLREQYPSVAVSLSSEVDPAFREYERTCVTAFDAYVKPCLETYLDAMERRLDAAGSPAPLQIMQSRGGICSSSIARRRPVRLFLSGPAAGVVGANEVGRSVGLHDLISVDIGGTSSDIALITDSRPAISPLGSLDSYQIRVPMIDINAVGAGGGSIAWIDVVGGLRVGPESAGADPGPACYGRGGTRATVTDASLVLGLLNPTNFAGGTMTLDAKLASDVIESAIAKPLGISTEEAALGIHRVANVQMAEGIRLVSVRKGIDPREFALVAFGGAGPLHATALADELGIDTILIPGQPGVLSAAGLLAASIEHEVSSTFIMPFAALDVDSLRGAYAMLESTCSELMAVEDVVAESLLTTYFADACYVGQAHFVEIEIDPHATRGVPEAIEQAFFARYEQLYGHRGSGPARLVNLRVVQTASSSSRRVEHGQSAHDVPGEPIGTRTIRTEHAPGGVDALIYRREDMCAGQRVSGPAIVEQPDTTVLLEPGWHALVAEQGVLVVRRGDQR